MRPARALIGIVVLAVAGCQAEISPMPSGTSATPVPTPIGPPPIFEPPEYPPEIGPLGGKISVGALREPSTTNPYADDPALWPMVGPAIWAGLVVTTHELRYVPGLASEIPTSDNGRVVIPGNSGPEMTVEWRLRPDLRWSDGEPLTCDDFRFAWEWLRGRPLDGQERAGIDVIEGIDCQSDGRMLWRFSEVYEGYLGILQYPLPRHAFEDAPPDVADFGPGSIAALPVSGPFSVERWEPGAGIVLRRNEFHRGFASDIPARLDRLTFTWFADPEALIRAFRDGTIHIGLGIPGRDAAAVQDLGGEVQPAYGLGTHVLRLNWAGGSITADPAIRQAISLAIDRGAVARVLEGDDAAAAESIVNPMAWFYSEQPAVERDLDAARTALEDAGWIDANGDGRRERNGTDASLTLCTTTDPAETEAGSLIAGWLGEIGIEATERAVPSADLEAGYASAGPDVACNVARGNYDIALQTLGGSIDAAYLFARYHSGQVPPAGQNAGRIDDPQIDEALDGIRTTVEFAAVKQLAGFVQERSASLVVEVPIAYERTLVLVGPRLGNFFAGIEPGSTWNVVDWYVSE